MTTYTGPDGQTLTECDSRCHCGGSCWNGAVGQIRAKDEQGCHWRAIIMWSNDVPPPSRWERVTYAGDEE